MKKNKMITAFLVLIMLMGTVLNVSAADRRIEFDGSTKKFNVGANTGENFNNLMPGDNRQIEVDLVNNDATEMKFYLDTHLVENLAAAASHGVMDFSVEVIDNAGARSTLFSAIIADGKTQVSAGEDAMTTDNKLLLATLAKGHKATVVLNLSVDGSSTENAYMRTSGQIDIGITAETKDDYTTIRRISNIIRTGDPAGLAIIGVVALSLIVIIALVVMKRKKKEEEVR
ncbi:hypothetical protein M2145_001398 [Lachnospiraceae bacterium PF1-21]|uniref:LPXTG cell wall anchor domain-containing protein n=1 Tax=Ohessyouella blattaphilus TaxID=2949333 RepID=A0ABT1EKI8_9FIRM|nr:hypothetical protein [Ohessyouella blattaphilus]MCP1111193.1 hypothetical protein [Ohessyouella blattaphilus]MCR8564587.1 hypothetical protein [Ohessyouella blattaphilus]